MKTIKVEFKKDITISANNSKLGKIPNISGVPVKDCVNCQECRKDCYALKAYKQYPAVRKAWLSNSKLVRHDMNKAERDINAWFDGKKKKPDLFRIHVAGDFIDQNHLNMWARIVANNPATQFLAFTKSSLLNFNALPVNLQVIHSQWVGQDKLNDTGLNAWIDGDSRAPVDVFVCKGSASQGGLTCDKCRYCFDNPKQDVLFKLH